MNRLILLLAVLIVSNASALTNNIPDDIKRSSFKTLEQLNVEALLFNTNENLEEEFDIDQLEVIELEEDVDLGFDTKKYLPEGFNPLAGKDDIDWSTIELVEIEEEVDLGFDTKKYLPKDFNPYKGMDREKDVVVCLY